MTLLDDRPVTRPTSEPTSRRRSPLTTWRFASRLARREVRRRPGRTLLAALLIALPVGVMTIGSVLARSSVDDWAADFQRDYGDADLVVGVADWYGGGAGETASSALPAGAVVLGEYLRTSTMITPVDAQPNDRYWVEFATADFDNPAEVTGIEVTDGQAPSDGEVLLDPEVAGRLGVGIGDELTLERPSGTWTVSGFGRMRGNYWADLVVISGFDVDRLAPDQLVTTTLVALPDGTSVDEIRSTSAEFGALNRYDDPWPEYSTLGQGMAWGYVGGVLALVAVGIIVAAAFATSARRQLMTIGQLAANGADESVVRRTLALQGSWTGLIGVVIGVGGGFALLPVAAAVAENHFFHHELTGLDVGVLDIVIISVTAVVAATIAALVPARSAARVPVMSALAGRRLSGRPPKWLVPTGLTLFAGGLGLIAIAALGAEGSNGTNNTWAAIVVIGSTAMVFGVCCAAPLVVERAGSLGRRAPLSWRMALRSLARSRTRSAAVVAAIAVTAGAAVAGGAVLESAIRSNALCCPPMLPADTVVVSADQMLPTVETDGMVDPAPVPPIELPAEVAVVLDDDLGPDVTVEPLYTATFDPAPFDPNLVYNEPYGPRIATPTVLDLFGLSARDRATLEERGSIMPRFGAVDSTVPAFPVEMTYVAEDGPIYVEFTSSADSTRYSWDGQFLMTEAAAVEAGFHIVPTAYVVRTGSPLTAEQLDLLGDVQESLFGVPVDAFVEPGDPPRTAEMQRTGMLDSGDAVTLQFDDPTWRQVNDDELWIARLAIVGGALLLTSMVVAIGLALAAAEGRDERDTFVVVGAPPSSIRRQAAARAAVMALVGIVLGVPLGYLPVWVVDRITNRDFDPYTYPVTFPWLLVGAVVLAIPLAVAAGAWGGSGLTQRFRPASPTRRD